MLRTAIRSSLVISLFAGAAFAHAAEGKLGLPSVSIACTDSIPGSCFTSPGPEVPGANCAEYACNGAGMCVNTANGAQCVPLQVFMTPAEPAPRASAVEGRFSLPAGGGCAVAQCRTGSTCMNIVEGGKLQAVCVSLIEMPAELFLR
jgi:hypothetical protein